MRVPVRRLISLLLVFLRILENYPGILFMTTNRVGNLDSAFHTRIHLILFSPELTASTTLDIWKRLLRRLKKTQSQRGIICDIDESDILRFAYDNFSTLNWNGRQIKNAFQSCIALAEYEMNHVGDAGTLDVGTRHFKAIAEASQKFDDYVRMTIGNPTGSVRQDAYRLGSIPSMPKSDQKTNRTEGEDSPSNGSIDSDGSDDLHMP